MPVDKSKYPKNWDDIAAFVKAAAGDRCELCQVADREPIGRGDNFAVLTVHHLNEDTHNSYDWNLIALCDACHLAVHRKGDGRAHRLTDQCLLFGPADDPVSHRWREREKRFRQGCANPRSGVDLHKLLLPRLQIVPITLREAHAYVDRHHRTHARSRGGLFAVAVRVENADEVCGVAVVGRPVSRMLDDSWTVEVTRCCTNGTHNACSALYGAAWRAARSLGYRRAITYTLEGESGASLRGAGWACLGATRGGGWSRKGRPRVDEHPTQRKVRWQAGEDAA